MACVFPFPSGPGRFNKRNRLFRPCPGSDLSGLLFQLFVSAKKIFHLFNQVGLEIPIGADMNQSGIDCRHGEDFSVNSLVVLHGKGPDNPGGNGASGKGGVGD